MSTAAKVLMLANDNHVVDRRIIQQACALRDYGYSVEVISGFEVGSDRVENHSGIVVHRYSLLPPNTPVARWLKKQESWVPGVLSRLLIKAEKVCVRLLGRNTEFERQVGQRVEQLSFDILHVHDMPLLRIGSQIAQSRGCKLVYDAHELYFAQKSIPWLARVRMRREEAKYIHRPQLVYTVNQFIADEMIKLYGRGDIKVLLNSAPTTSTEAVSSPTLHELAGLSADQKIVLYQGWISRERGLEPLIEAARHFRGSAALVIVGYGEYVESLKRHVLSIGLSNSVRFLGRLSYEELGKLTGQADVGVIPYIPCDFNTKHCSPNKFFEFIAAGVPVVANDLPFLRSQLEKYGCGKVADIFDSKAFASTVAEVLRDRQMKSACLRTQLELGWDVERLRLVDWYSQLR